MVMRDEEPESINSDRLITGVGSISWVICTTNKSYCLHESRQSIDLLMGFLSKPKWR